MRIAVLAAVSFITFGWILIPMRADGISMQPTYRSGSFHLVNRLAFTRRPPARGDVVGIRLAGPHLAGLWRGEDCRGETSARSDRCSHRSRAE